MKPNQRWTRQQLYAFSLVLILAVVLTAIGKRAFQNPRRASSEKPPQVEEWVYFSSTAHDALSRFSGRPGRLISRDEEGATVEYQLHQSPAPLETVMVPATISLQPCPPQQGDVDDDFTGTIRIWKGSEETPLKDQRQHEAKLGDTVSIEIKNLDRWLFTQFDFGRLKTELGDVPSFVKDVVDDAVAARRAADLLRGISEVNYKLRTPPLRDTLASESTTRNQVWHDLMRRIDNDIQLKRIKDKMPQPLAGENPTPENVDKLQRQFLPIKVWSHHITEKKFKQLTLTLNGVVLTGITPQNAYNLAEVEHETRPSFQEDLYQWARFVLERKQIDPNATEKATELAKANQSAWFKLIGKPAFKLPCNVTLRLPDEGLELPTKITAGAPDHECRFKLIGIEPWKFCAAILIFLCILFFLIWLAKTTNILRESSGVVRADGLEPVSLAKTQMSFWFIVTACAFAFLWVTTGNYDTINETCLVLLGIGSGTALGAAFIESASTKYLVTSSLNKPRQQIKAEIANAILARLTKLSPLVQDAATREQFIDVLRKLEKTLNANESGDTYATQRKEVIALRENLQQEWYVAEKLSGSETNESAPDAIIALAKKLKPVAPTETDASKKPTPPSEVEILAGELELLAVQEAEFEKMPDTAWKRLFADWLSEGSSTKYSFHRFQMLAWTLLLGFVFVAKVLSDRAMPEFNAMTLSLLGISAGTYLGFKIPEARKQEALKNP
jgi:hypothetical protein